MRSSWGAGSARVRFWEGLSRTPRRREKRRQEVRRQVARRIPRHEAGWADGRTGGRADIAERGGKLKPWLAFPLIPLLPPCPPALSAAVAFESLVELQRPDRGSVAERKTSGRRSVLSPHIGNRVRTHERRRQQSPSLGDREMVQPLRGGGRIASCQDLGHLGVEPVSHADQERSLLDLDVLIAGMTVRRNPVTVR